MPGFRDFLVRFRPAGAPGRAARPGVPADRISELSAELEPLFALLADAEAEAAGIRHAAADQAEQCRQGADRQAQAIVADARASAGAVRADTATRARDEAASEWTHLAAQADAGIEELRTRVAERMPAYVHRVVTEALALLDGTVAEASARPRHPDGSHTVESR